MAVRNWFIVIPFIFYLYDPCFSAKNELSDDLDSFQELLFDTSQCENFISDGEYVAVATIDCPPVMCDFPRQLCMRPSTKHSDITTNQCTNIPKPCLEQLNIEVKIETTSKNLITATAKPNQSSITTVMMASTEVISTLATLDNNEEQNVTITESFNDICTMDQPMGRFCGFTIKFAYNRETQRCEQFWFPGCRTQGTNGNLFDSIEQCHLETQHCSTQIRSYTSNEITDGLLHLSPHYVTTSTTRYVSSHRTRRPGISFTTKYSPAKIETNHEREHSVHPKNSLFEIISKGISMFTGSGVDSSNNNILSGIDLKGISHWINGLRNVR